MGMEQQTELQTVREKQTKQPEEKTQQIRNPPIAFSAEWGLL